MSTQEEDKGYQPLKDDLDYSNPPNKDSSSTGNEDEHSNDSSEGSISEDFE